MRRRKALCNARESDFGEPCGFFKGDQGNESQLPPAEPVEPQLEQEAHFYLE